MSLQLLFLNRTINTYYMAIWIQATNDFKNLPQSEVTIPLLVNGKYDLGFHSESRQLFVTISGDKPYRLVKWLSEAPSIPEDVLEALESFNPYRIGNDSGERSKGFKDCINVIRNIKEVKIAAQLRELLQKDFPSHEPDKLQRLRNVLSDESEQKRLRGKTIEHLTIQTVIAKIDLLLTSKTV